MKKLYLIIFSFSIFAFVFADAPPPPLTLLNNAPRAGDEIPIDKYEVSAYKKAGEKILWDFSDASITSGFEKIKILFQGDECFALKTNNIRNYYQLSEDSLYWSGFERRQTIMRDSIAGLKYIYPIAYGDSCSGNFIFKGTHSITNPIISAGTIKTKADGYGTIILPDGDTITDVLRLKIETSISGGLTNSIVSPTDTCGILHLNTYEWYAPGYRYPIFWVNSISANHSELSSALNTEAYYCARSMQEYHIKNDEANEKIRKLINDYKSSENHTLNDSLISNIEIDVKDNFITISFESTVQDGIVQIALSQINGIPVRGVSCHDIEEGHNEITFDIPALTAGEYAILLVLGEIRENLTFIIK